MLLEFEPLTAQAFVSFGEVISADAVTPVIINAGQTQKFPDLAHIEAGAVGRVQLSIYRSQPIELPFRIQVMERHPLGSQAFYPLHARPFPVVVAASGSTPGAATIRAFMSDGRQGVNIRAGVWHHYQLSLGEISDYLVIDRGGPGANCEECTVTGVRLNKLGI